MERLYSPWRGFGSRAKAFQLWFLEPFSVPNFLGGDSGANVRSVSILAGLDYS